MAKKKSGTSASTGPTEPPRLVVSRHEASARLTTQVEFGEELARAEIVSRQALDLLRDKRKVWHDRNTELLRRLFDSAEYADAYSRVGVSMISLGPTSLAEDVESFRDDVRRYTTRLRSVLERLDLVPEPDQLQSAETVTENPMPGASRSSSSVKIFISHRTTDAALAKAVADLLRESLGLEFEHIRCTSATEYALNFGSDPIESLRVEVVSVPVLLGLITRTSLESQWVLFELGGRWVTKKAIIPMVAGGATFADIPDQVKMHGLRLAEMPSVLKLVDDIAQILEISPRPTHRYFNLAKSLAEMAEAPPPSGPTPSSARAGDGTRRLGRLLKTEVEEWRRFGSTLATVVDQMINYFAEKPEGLGKHIEPNPYPAPPERHVLVSDRRKLHDDFGFLAEPAWEALLEFEARSRELITASAEIALQPSANAFPELRSAGDFARRSFSVPLDHLDHLRHVAVRLKSTLPTLDKMAELLLANLPG